MHWGTSLSLRGEAGWGAGKKVSSSGDVQGQGNVQRRGG